MDEVQDVKTLLPSSPNADIAVLKTDQVVPEPFQIKAQGEDSGVTLGQTVWFLGYPFGLGSSYNRDKLPFIKRGTMSAIDGSDLNAVVLYIDGFNNEGFSGGPVMFWDFNAHVYRLLGVVMGYREETAKTQIKNGKQVDTKILVNSGILIAYSIKHAVEAIEEDQQQSGNSR